MMIKFKEFDVGDIDYEGRTNRTISKGTSKC